MIDWGFSKLTLIGIVALLVLGPEKLPTLARTLGTFLGRAQRYINDLKAEVARMAELDELRRMKHEMQQAVSHLEHNLHSTASSVRRIGEFAESADVLDVQAHTRDLQYPVAALARARRKNWRARRSGVPQWYKVRSRARINALPGATRVARYRPAKPLQ